MKKKGFTMIEMLVVLLIIGTLSATLIPSIGNARQRASDTARVANVLAISSALIQYSLDNSTYPEDAKYVCDEKNTSESVLAGPEYGLGGTIPLDPETKECYSYKSLNDNSHFVICAKMSDESDGGNSPVNLGDESPRPTLNNPGGGSTRIDGNLGGGKQEEGKTDEKQKPKDPFDGQLIDKPTQDQIIIRPKDAEDTYEYYTTVLQDGGDYYCYVG